MKFSVITSAFNQLPIIKKAKPYWDNQTFKDFEWIIADDGSTDGMGEWAKDNGLKHVYQVNKGYRLSKILNKAAREACGEYLVWVMGDSYPKEDFLEQLDKYVDHGSIFTGVRVNVDEAGKVVSPDWRLGSVDISSDVVPITSPYPWGFMTLNSMCMGAGVYEKIGGMCEEYETYGREDWDMVMRAHYMGFKSKWIPKALIFHTAHKEKAEAEKNIKLFEAREERFRV